MPRLFDHTAGGGIGGEITSIRYEQDPLKLINFAKDYPEVYGTATFMHPRGMLVTKRDISPSGWGKLGWLQKYQEFNVFGSLQGGAGRPIPFLERTLIRATSFLPRMRSPFEVPDIIADLAGDDTTWAQVVSDDEATWYKNRVYDLVGVPIFLGVSANITGPGSIATEGLPTAAGPSEYNRFAKAVRSPSYNNAQQVQGIARKYVRGELSERDNSEIEKNIDSLIAQVELTAVGSKWRKTIKSQLETLKKTMAKSRNEARAVQKQKRKNEFETRRQNRADTIGGYSVAIAGSKAEAQAAKASRADTIGGYSVAIAGSKAEAQAAKASRANTIGGYSVAVAGSKADATLANAKAKALLTSLVYYRRMDNPDKVEETKLELSQLIGSITDPKIAEAIGDAMDAEDADAEDTDAEDTPDIRTYLDFVLECVDGDRIAARGGMDTAAGPPRPTALVIFADDDGETHQYWYTLTGGNLVQIQWGNPTPEETTIVLLGLFGGYTNDVATREFQQRHETLGRGYWFSEETVTNAANLVNRNRVFTITNVPRIGKWIEQKNLGRERSGTVRASEDAMRIQTKYAKLTEILRIADLFPVSSEVYVGSY